MATNYIRRFNLKDSLSDSEVASFWRFVIGEFAPAIQKGSGIRSIKFYSGAGALRADLSVVIEMDHAGVYETLLRDPNVGKGLGQFYGAIDLKSSTQMFRRELTPDLLKALGA